jgi:hypothetical protein
MSMTRISVRRTVCAVASLALVGACGVASGHEITPSASGSASGSASVSSGAVTESTGSGDHSHHGSTASGTPSATGTGAGTTAPPAAVRPGTVKVVGTPVANLRTDAAPAETSNFCDQSDLPAGEGKADKGNTCVSTPLGEVADHPVRVAANPRSFFNRTGGKVKVRVLVADNQGVLDLNAFTFDSTGGAGVTLHERPAELQDNGRPLLHCHIGITTVARVGALPGEDYDAAFSGLQGFRGDLTAEITGLPRGTYRGDVYCSGPGHPMLPTSKATEVQAFDTFDFKVIGR